MNDIKRLDATLERLESGRDVFGSSDFDWDNLNAERAGRGRNLAHLQHGAGTADIGDDRQPAQTGDNLAQQFELLELGRDLGGALAAPLRPAKLDREIMTLDLAEFAQPLHKSGGPWAPGRRRGRA